MCSKPKILLCTNYEEVWKYFEKYQDTILGVISDIDFKRKRQHDDIPILLQSNHVEYADEALATRAHFI
jgi:hypothetical protein